MKRILDKEQFFTTEDNVDLCLSKLNLNDYDRIIEPSAGNGSFSSKIKNVIAYDIEPLADNIIKQDFLTLDINKEGKTLVVGNPPFGRQSSMAIKFINKAATFADTIAFILPLSFKKDSVIHKLDKHVHPTSFYELNRIDFFFNEQIFKIPCGFFIFEVKEELRKEKEKSITSDFTFVKKEDADNSIRRVGFYAGRIEGLDVSSSSHYFIKWNKDGVKERFNSLKFEYNNVGARSLSKNEIIETYNLCKGFNNDD